MDEDARRSYHESYEQEKARGVPFFPDALYKDAIIALLVFVALVGFSFFLGTPLEARADPSDTTYTPRPEWYFLFLFQLLKYFPGKLEVVGVFVLPTLLGLLLFALPLLDRRPDRHFAKRPLVVGGTAFLALAVGVLTAQSVLEAPPPVEVAPGDQTAALYIQNCAACHGASVTVPPGINLHEVIAQGNHEGMPAWSGDLTSDEIDALAGFVLSPAGSQLFVQNCGDCHAAPELVAGDPLELDRALELGAEFPAHAGQPILNWAELLSPQSRDDLLNFLVAPDGQRLFAVNCSPCHGRAVPVRGDEADLRSIISQGGLHLEMPPWREQLSEDELETLARYVADPGLASGAEPLFALHCASCHGERVPSASDLDQARQIIATGGPHMTMPIWGEVLTSEQLDALVAYTLQAASGASLEVGRQLFTENCAPCHGNYGEGGANPTRSDDIIAPISSAEYLRTRDNTTLRAVIAAGQPNIGMSPFGTGFGGPLDDQDIEAIVSFIRSWEADPPVEIPPEVAVRQLAITGPDIYAEVCSQYHGPEGAGLIGPSLRDPEFQARNTDDAIFDIINRGHAATPMISWGEILTARQIQELVDFIRDLTATEPTAAGGPPSFKNDVLPILQSACGLCHGTLGGWDASSYQAVMNSGDHAPVVIPGQPEESLLAKKLLGTQEQGQGSIMPPSGALSPAQIQLILDWIAAGALDD